MPEELEGKQIWFFIIAGLIIIAITIPAMWGLLRLNRYVFKRIQKKHEGLHLLFFQRVSSAIILIIGVIFVFSLFGGLDSVWKSLLGGTAIISAVLAFAAQDVIKDILAGLMISIHKPFEIGNRIELEDGTTGIVKDMTMRHVVLRGIDTQSYVIPNSKLNLMKVRNFSYHAHTRAANFDFRIAYGSDVKLAMQVIKDAIISSPFSIPGIEAENGYEYADIYFTAYEESSLRMTTTVYFESAVRSEVLISDINCRVNQALRDNAIEIPYQYINVVQKQKDTYSKQ